jgi:hypothetical protein
MSVNQIKPKEINHSMYELRFLEMEAAYKKLEKLLQTVDHSRQFNAMKINQVIIF